VLVHRSCVLMQPLPSPSPSRHVYSGPQIL
jgi:hypothetical protein